jgi:CubicO group peptidase (beta-lactamase class C family)
MRTCRAVTLALFVALSAQLCPQQLWAQQQSTTAACPSAYPHADEPIGTVRQVYDGVLPLDLAVQTFRNIERLFPTRTIRRSSTPVPLPGAVAPLRTVSFRAGGKTYSLDDYLELNRVAALLVLKNGQVALERYRFGNTACTRWMSMSIAKSITSTLIGAAIKQGYIRSLADPVTQYVPVLIGSAYDRVSVRDVLMMASGVRWDETYTNPASDRRRWLEAHISQTHGAAMGVMRNLPRATAPGTMHNYNTGETQVAAELLRATVQQPLATYLSERIWSRFGMESDAYWWLEALDGIEIGGSGISATLRDYGRFGLFLLHGGVASGEGMLPDGWLSDATSPKVLAHGTPVPYGYLWWTPTTAPSQRDGAYAACGIYGQRLYVNPAAQVVIVSWAAQAQPTGAEGINFWVFFDAVVDALR